LADINYDDPVTVNKNDYYRNVDGVEHSEATFTELKSKDGIIIRLAQGLGPFIMSTDGNIIKEDPGITRFAVVHFEDGSDAKVTFDPVPGLPRLHSLVEWDGERLIVPDNTIKKVIGSVALHVSGLGRDKDSTKGLGVRNAIKQVENLAKLRQSAQYK
jgi:hypothetical protein